MAPDLNREEDDRLRKLAGRDDPEEKPGFVFPQPNDQAFLAEILLRVIRAMEADDSGRAERNERGIE